MKIKYIITAIVVVVIVIAAVSVYAYLTLGTGTLKIEMTDPPEDWNGATQVYLNYSAIDVHRANAGNDSGWSTVIGASGWINLTKTLSVNQTIGSQNLQPGTYNLIRFKLRNATITIGGVNKTASVPSGMLQIAITQGGVQVKAGQTSALLINLNIQVKGSASSGYNIVPDVRAIPI